MRYLFEALVVVVICIIISAAMLASAIESGEGIGVEVVGSMTFLSLFLSLGGAIMMLILLNERRR